jgi:hypothetical protein
MEIFSSEKISTPSTAASQNVKTAERYGNTSIGEFPRRFLYMSQNVKTA